MKTAVTSKTVILNTVSFLVAILTMFVNVPFISDPTVKELIVAIVAVLNIILRWGGTQPIKGVV